MDETGPRTEAGRRLAALWPLTRTEQMCCPYPHGDRSGASGVQPDHQRVAEIKTEAAGILAIESEARSKALDEVEAAVGGQRALIVGTKYEVLAGEAVVKAVLAAIASLRQGDSE